MSIYIASRFRNKGLVRETAQRLHHLGFVTTQTWPDFDETGAARADIAQRDLRDVDLADIVLVLTEDCAAVPGGMHFEAGYGYGRGKKLVVVGPPVNIFYELPKAVLCADLVKALEYLVDDSRTPRYD